MLKLSLKAARTNANLSQSDVAKVLGVSKSTVSRWERGNVKIPDDCLQKICIMCDCSPGEIREYSCY